MVGRTGGDLGAFEMKHLGASAALSGCGTGFSANVAQLMSTARTENALDPMIVEVTVALKLYIRILTARCLLCTLQWYCTW